MSITFNCNCGRQLVARDEHAGRKTRCPACNAITAIPASGKASPAASSPARDTGARGPGPSTAQPRNPKPAGSRPGAPARQPLAAPDNKKTEEILDVLPAEEEAYEVIDDFEIIDDEAEQARPAKKKVPERIRHQRRSRIDSDEYPRERRSRESSYSSFDTAGVGVGLLMMLGAIAWFVVGLYGGVIFFYPPVLFVVGAVAFCKGLMGMSD